MGKSDLTFVYFWRFDK